MKTIRTASSLIRSAAISGLALLLVPVLASAQELPSASSLVEKYVAASGGRQALEKASEAVTTGTFSMPGAGLSGDMVSTAAPNRIHVSIEMPGIGTILSGFDGTTAWSSDPMQGARILEGAERQAVVDASSPGAAFRDPSVVESMTTTSQDTINDVACWSVDVTWKSGRKTTDCYSLDTGLLHASTATQESPMGTVTVTSVFNDYKEFGGVMIATRVVQQMMGQQVVMSVSDVKIGNVPAEAFEPPAEVKALIGG